MQRNNFAIPRKSLDQFGQSETYLSDISINSDAFRNAHERIILSHLSNSCQKREAVRILRCRIINNKRLETKFSDFRRLLESQGTNADVSFGFALQSDNEREIELISQYGLSANNNFVGDLGEPAFGVYLSEHPDLVTPAPFLGRTKIKILACKVLKGRCSIVGLGSYRLMPMRGHHSHAALQPVDSKLTRHDNYRCDQIFLFEEEENGYSKSPGNVLPYAIYDVEFPANTAHAFKAVESIVWSGNLLIGSKCYSRVSLCSLAGAAKPPLPDVFEITHLIHWTACLAYLPILELLKPPALGEIVLKKEVHLTDSRRLAYYFTLHSEDNSYDFLSLHESMRIRRTAGITVFPSFGIFILLPNGSFTDLLTLPRTTGSAFHCLYLTTDSSCSLISGTFDALSAEENDEFTRPLLLQERVDGLDVRVQELVRDAAQKLSNDHFGKKLGIPGEMPNASTEPVDMEIAEDSDDDEEKRGWRDEHMDVTSGLKRLSKDLENPISSSISCLKSSSPRSVSEAVTKAASLLTSDPRRERTYASRDPRKRQGLINNSTLPVPSSAVSRRVSSWSSSREHFDNERKPILSSSEAPVADSRSYSPSDAISSGGSSPKAISHSQKSPHSSSPIHTGGDSALSAMKNESGPDETESPASPPHEPGVFVAAAPKIISDYDMRSVADSSFQTSRQYRPPEVTPFTALASMEAMKSSNKQQQEIKVNDALSTCRDNENRATDNEPSYILPELVSFPYSSTKRASVVDEKSNSLLNPSAQHSLWGILPSVTEDRDLSSWEGKSETTGTGDVDMRTMHPATCVPEIPREALPSTTHQMAPVIQAPIVFSNGDTDHRIITAAARPSTSAQPLPESFTSEIAGRSSISPFSPFTPASSTKSVQYHSSSSTVRGTGFEEPLVYGFFNQPIVRHPPKPYYAEPAKRDSFSSHLPRRGILMIDDAQFLNGSLDPVVFRIILERFSSWRRSSSILWWVKLHTHIKQALASDGRALNSNQLAIKFAHYEEIIAEYENLKVIQTMKPHECDERIHDVNIFLKCLSHIADMNRKCAMIYLTDIAKDSPLGKQIASTDFEICASADVLKKFDL